MSDVTGITAIKIRIPRLAGADGIDIEPESEAGGVAVVKHPREESFLEVGETDAGTTATVIGETRLDSDEAAAIKEAEPTGLPEEPDAELSELLDHPPFQVEHDVPQGFMEVMEAERLASIPGLTAEYAAGIEAEPDKRTEALAEPGPTPEPLPASVGKIKMLVVLGHPREGSFCEGLAEAYSDAALAGGHEVRLLKLRTLEFDLHERQQPLEPTLESAQESLLWADHVVFVFPVWWGSMPALLKGFLDRTLRAGFAFQERPEGGWDGLLHGRTAEILVTTDTPKWSFDHLLGAPAVRALRDATLKFCGLGPARVIEFGPVLHSTPQQRSRWLDQASEAARQAQARHRTGWRPRLRAWRDVARLPFYAFPLLVVLLGAFTAANLTAAPVAWSALILAVLATAVVKFITVLTNEWHDLPTDSRNHNHGPLTGGSRVLVENRLTIPQLLRGRNVALGVLLALTTALVFCIPAAASSVPAALLLMAGLGLGLASTAPPFKLASRGLGEVTAAFTHSVLVFWIGYASQGGPLANLIPWALTAPMFVALLPAALLAGLPDLEADEAVGKKTMAVHLGRRRLTKAALAVTVLSVLGHVAMIPFSGWWLTLPLVMHAGWLGRGLLDYLARPQPGRIDGLLFRALSYMFWFFLAPALG